VTREAVGLLLANAGFFAVGAAAFTAAGWLTGDRAGWYRLGAAYPFGLAVVVIPTSYLALFGFPVAITAIGVGAVVVLAAGARSRPWRTRGRVRGRLLRPRSRGGVLGGLLFLALGVLLAYAARTFWVRPDLEWDSWAVWLAKARLLYTDPSAAPAALRSGNYGRTTYPIGLPTLEALGFKAMGRYDSTAIGLQLLLLACAFPLALWSLLRARARTWMIALASIAIVGAPQILYQLLTRYADVPLGLFVGLGVAAGAAWLIGRPGETWLAGCFTAFLGMAGLIKSEGLLFALAGCAALAAGAAAGRNRARIRPAATAIGAVLVVITPWQLYTAAYGLTNPDYDLANAVNPSYLSAHADRVWPAAGELSRQLDKTSSWGLLTWVILLALVAGLLARQWPLLAFAGTWLLLSAVGLLVVYWISTLPQTSNLSNSSYRTIVSLLVAGGALVPLFLFPLPSGLPGGGDAAASTELVGQTDLRQEHAAPAPPE
jgi:hypothetical protein